MAEIRLLLVEDNPDDALLVDNLLRSGGIEATIERIETAEAMDAALRASVPDLVVCDYQLPDFSAEEALDILHDSELDVPFLLLSGYIGEDAAVEMMRAGAHDFVRKDNLGRMIPAVQRELRYAEGRRQRRAVEEALRASEEHFRMLAEHAQDMVFRCRLRPHAEVVYVSAAAESVTGYPEDQLLGPPHHIFDHIIDAAERARFERSWRSGAATALIVQWQRRDGSTCWLEQRASGVYEREQLVAVEGALRNITQRVLAERERASLARQLEQTERMEALGILAGGVAHDFNNSLAVILASADFLIDDLDGQHPPNRADVNRIINAGNRSAALTNQLLLFARRQSAQPEVIDVNTTVAGLEELIRRTIGEDIEVTCELSSEPSLVKIVRSQFEQIVLNLVSNSRAAMPTGGVLRIANSLVTVTAGDGLKTAPGLYARLCVTDSGDGMPPEVLEHAFEPFFTTKRPGEGTGLGLATAYGVVEQAGGCIVLRSAPGQGTTVSIYLPVTQQLPAADTADSGSRREGNDETVLLVEDEEQVRDVVSRTLHRHHYNVVAVASPEEALRVCAETETPVDLLLTDLIMPGMSGVQLAAHLHDRRPELPVVYMSGYAADHLHTGVDDGAATTLLHKPFTASTLLARLREALDGQ